MWWSLLLPPVNQCSTGRSNMEIGICLSQTTAHLDQHPKASQCDNWRSECERKGHVYWQFENGGSGNKCLDCGATNPQDDIGN